MEYISKKYNITLIKKQSKFERDYPLMMERIEALENRQDARIYTDNDYINQVIGKKKD